MNVIFLRLRKYSYLYMLMKLCLLDLANSNTIYLSIQILISGQVTKNLEKNSLWPDILHFHSAKIFF
jgi:hypothetical protein